MYKGAIFISAPAPHHLTNRTINIVFNHAKIAEGNNNLTITCLSSGDFKVNSRIEAIKARIEG
jgi:hypothetical protein